LERLSVMKRHMAKIAGLALVATAGLVGITPTAAAAAVPGLLTVTASTGSDSNVYKSVQVFCPVGRVVVGGGYDLIGAEGSVVLDDFIPSASGLLVGAGEIVGPGEPSDGTTASWRIQATAVCANPVPGYTIVSAVSTFNPGKARAADAFCPTGTVAIGNGASLSNGFGQISIEDNERFDAYVQAVAVDDEDGYSGSWSITAYAICATPLPGLRTVIGASSFDSSSPKVAFAPCPGGQVLLGGAWSLGASGTTVAEQLLNTRISIGGNTLTGFASEDANGYSGTWTSRSYATCADA
jgi:hypothetical protein